MDRLPGHLLRHAHKIQGQLWLSAHGVDVAEGVGGGDLPEQVGVVGNGREEIHRLHQGQLIGDFVDRGVVALIKPHQQIGVLVNPYSVQKLRQHPGPYLCAASGAAGQLGELDCVFHQNALLLPLKCRIASSTPPPTASALSEAQRQWASSHRGSTSPLFMPFVTGTPSARSPRRTPPMVQAMGAPST